MFLEIVLPGEQPLIVLSNEIWRPLPIGFYLVDHHVVTKQYQKKDKYLVGEWRYGGTFYVATFIFMNLYCTILSVLNYHIVNI